MNIGLFIRMLPIIGMLIILGMMVYLGFKYETIDKTGKYAQDFYEYNSDKKDISEIMCNNLKELKGYYQLSKEQANKAFKFATIACVIGIIFYCIAIITSIISKDSNVTPTIISGTFVEFISGSVFIIYKKSLNQLETYHNKLEQTEKYLIVIKIINNMTQEKQNERYSYLINKILGD